MIPNSTDSVTSTSNREPLESPFSIRCAAPPISPALKIPSGKAFTFKTAASPEQTQLEAVADTRCSVAPPSALTNEDILGLVFQELHALFGVEDLKKRNQSLLWAAQTSKTFFRPAVGVLWRIIQSLLPLLKILPQFKTSNTVHTLVGPIPEEDWSRFEIYAQSVRLLDVDPPTDIVANDVYVQVARLHPDPLLPGLQRMNIPLIADGFTDNLAPLFHCITSTLSSVNIGTINGPRAALLTTSLLAALSREAINLQNLSVDARIPSEAIDILVNSPSLRNLELSINSTISQSNFNKLLGLPRVFSVSIHFSNSGSLAGDPPKFGLQSLNNLKVIRVSGNDDQIKQVFATIPFSLCSLENIDIFFQSLPPSGSLHAWRYAPSTLRRLKLEVGHSPNSTRLPELQLSDFAPFASNIVSLELNGFNLRATDDDILKILNTERWKNLETLTLPCFGHSDSVSSPSILILGEIITWCPKIRFLSICVDLDLHDDNKLRETLLTNVAAQTSSHKLECLAINSIQAPTMDAFHQGILLAQYIDSVFPQLKSFAAYGNNHMDYWNEIWNTVKCCQLWRNQLVSSTKKLVGN